MKKSILNLGKSLNKTEQQNINGGFGPFGPSVCASSSNYILEGGEIIINGVRTNDCSFPSRASKGAFPGSRCYGGVINGVCTVG
ncbi:hypothetical protein [Tenacibaculum jejuense]|uniref:Uncharacterized protein n=1 Tax=Tenacibaculum jejuense TaxID=584609 RepID=A0A238UCB9_9FLAO|nr:hypothetical protein [Tenacibaculum jejuense]SNR16853.1 protein of unknown function [Tenacibaculum jejuense]